MNPARFGLVGLVALAVACGGVGGAAMSSGEPVDPSSAKAEDDGDVGGVGSLETRTERGEVGKLRLENVEVDAKQTGDVAEVAITHTFANDATVPLEGTFRFPMPEGALLTGLAMWVDGRKVEGELVANEKARKVYEEIVDSMQDPAIVEWEHGTTFKMRVFPIEPSAPKVVTLRYVVPLHARSGRRAFVQGTRSLDGSATLPRMTVTWNGRREFDGTNVAVGHDVVVDAKDPGETFRETTAEGTFDVVHVKPDWSKVPAAALGAPKNWLVVVDTSRSTLEERGLVQETVKAVLGGLGKAGARFALATSDLDTVVWSKGFVKADARTTDDALRHLGTVVPDGATDVSAPCRGSASGPYAEGDTGVVYVGDCEASWGETSVSGLRTLATKAFTGIPFYPVLLGGSVDVDVATELAAAGRGRVVRARNPEDVTSFVGSLVGQGKTGGARKRLFDAELVAAEGSVVLPTGKRIVEEGDDVVAYVRTPPGIAAPTTVTLHAVAEGRVVDTTVPLGGPSPAVATKRFGAQWIRELERAKKPKDEIVKASLAFEVLSRHTSFLVLESEEAYAKHGIERRADRAARTANLDSLGSSGVDISLDRIQPGDPEIFVDAPSDARHVFVVLPDGDVKEATYDPTAEHGRGAWMVRFLVDKDVPEGTYEARAFVELANGERETRTVTYVVDTTAPNLDVRVEPVRGRPGTFFVHVTHRAAKVDVDLRRVEVLTPDGQTLVLTAVRWGEFRATWTPVGSAHGILRAVGFDQALNHSEAEIVVP
ncbi:MAG: VIT and VWA domain-containing protein [Polyangiaceae bacterium]